MAASCTTDSFDEFFDTFGSSEDTAVFPHDSKNESVENRELQQPSKESRLGHSQNESVFQTDCDAYTDYATDSFTDSDSDSELQRQKHHRIEHRSRSSSRSGGSYRSGNSFSSTERRSRALSRQMKESRSRSLSERRSISRSRSTSPAHPIHIAVEKKTRKSKHNDSSDASSDSFSNSKTRDVGGRSLMSPTTRGLQDTSSCQAWNDVQYRRSRRKSTTDRQSRTEGEPARKGHSKKVQGKHYSEHSDSDMTDVSPIATPHGDSAQSRQSDTRKRFGPESDLSFKGVEDTSCVTDGGASDPLDFNALVNAVKALGKQTRVKSNVQRVMFDPHHARRVEKANYTFSNDDTHRIEQENKRLLRKILHPEKGKRHQPGYPRLQKAASTSSGVNRHKDHQRIESENAAFFKRLRDIRPSKGISRHEQLSAYNTTIMHGVPVAARHAAVHGQEPKRFRCKSATNSETSSLGHARSMSSIHSAATATSQGSKASSLQSRQSGNRPCSAKNLKQRPAWDDRW